MSWLSFRWNYPIVSESRGWKIIHRRNRNSKIFLCLMMRRSKRIVSQFTPFWRAKNLAYKTAKKSINSNGLMRIKSALKAPIAAITARLS